MKPNKNLLFLSRILRNVSWELFSDILQKEAAKGDYDKQDTDGGKTWALQRIFAR